MWRALGLLVSVSSSMLIVSKKSALHLLPYHHCHSAQLLECRWFLDDGFSQDPV